MQAEKSLAKYFFLVSIFIHSVLFLFIYSKNLKFIYLNQQVNQSSNSNTVLNARFYAKTKKVDKAKAQPPKPKNPDSLAKALSLKETNPNEISQIEPRLKETNLEEKTQAQPKPQELATDTQKIDDTFSADFSSQIQESNIPDELKIFFKTLSDKIEKNKFYPSLSKRLRESGTVIVKFEVHASGKVQNIILKEQCSFDRLNKSAYKVVASLDKLIPLPDKYKKIEITFPMSYVL